MPTPSQQFAAAPRVFARIALVLAALGACSPERTAGPHAPGERPAERLRLTAGGITDDVLAHAMARALMNDSARWALRDALRASPYARHRVRFQELMKSDVGRPIIRQLAQVLSAEESDVSDAIARLRPMEILLPKRDDRLNWHGTANVAVAASSVWGTAPSVAYTADGAAIGIAEFKSLSPKELGFTALVLRPERGMARRLHRQSDAPGNVVQDPSDEETAGRFVTYGRLGDSTVVDASEMKGIDLSNRLATFGGARRDMYCDPTTDCFGGSNGNSIPSGTTYLGRLTVIDGYDNGYYGSGLELRFDTKLWLNGTLVQENVAGIDTPANYEAITNMPLISTKWASGYEIEVEVWEDDGSWWDNHYGDFTIRSQLDNYANYPLAYWAGTGGGRCHGQESTFATVNWPECPVVQGTPTGNQYWYYAMINFNVHW